MLRGRATVGQKLQMTGDGVKSLNPASLTHHNFYGGWGGHFLESGFRGILEVRLRILDLFAGTGSATKAFVDRGHEVVRVELDGSFDADEFDVLDMTPEYIRQKYGQIDFIWASPPCTAFSVSSIHNYWKRTDEGIVPDNPKTVEALALVEYTINLIKGIAPTYGWMLENPRGMLRKQTLMQKIRRKTITYCQYGENHMKPTDIWGEHRWWTPRPMCNPSDTCHEPSPRGKQTGLQRIRDPKIRAMIPYELSWEIATMLDLHAEAATPVVSSPHETIT